MDDVYTHTLNDCVRERKNVCVYGSLLLFCIMSVCCVGVHVCATKNNTPAEYHRDRDNN